jgi:Tfp pilus assembly protein PilO
MNSFFDRLNLRPMERRLVTFVFIVVFVVLNVWFVRPHFNDLAKLQSEHDKSQKTLTRFRTEIANIPEYQKEKEKLEDTGGGLAPEEVAVQIRRTIQSQASQSGLVPSVNDLRSSARADKFFDEHAVKVSFAAGDKELVDFLFNLSAGKSMIRVKDLNVRPDPQLQRLQGEATVAVSYAKKTAASAKAPDAKPAATKPPAAKPTTNPTPATAPKPK